MRQLAAACRETHELTNIALHIVEQTVGSQLASEALTALRRLATSGWSAEQAALLIEEIAQAKENVQTAKPEYELVLSGPDLDGVHVRDTFAVVNELFVSAQEEVILVGYAVHNGKILFQRLAERMQDFPHLRVCMYLDIPRRRGDTSLASEIVRRFVHEFYSEHWPWQNRPNLLHDVRSLSESLGQRSSLHAKSVIVDRARALITSANFTSAAQDRNIEAGVYIDHPPAVKKLLDYLEGLRTSGVIREANS